MLDMLTTRCVTNGVNNKGMPHTILFITLHLYYGSKIIRPRRIRLWSFDLLIGGWALGFSDLEHYFRMFISPG